MIKQKAIYDKDYNLIEFIETSNGEITQIERYDNKGRLIYHKKGTKSYQTRIYKYNSTYVYSHNTTDDIIYHTLIFNKHNRVRYSMSNTGNYEIIRYYKNTPYITYRETQTGWEKYTYRKGIKTKKEYSDGCYILYRQNDNGDMIGDSYDKEGRYSGGSITRIKTQI